MQPRGFDSWIEIQTSVPDPAKIPIVNDLLCNAVDCGFAKTSWLLDLDPSQNGQFLAESAVQDPNLNSADPKHRSSERFDA